MSPVKPKNRGARLEARIDPEEKQLIQYAAAIEGVSFTSFVLSKLHFAAEDTIMRHSMVTLTTKGTATFANSLLNSPGPNEELQRAYADYLQFTGE